MLTLCVIPLSHAQICIQPTIHVKIHQIWSEYRHKRPRTNIKNTVNNKNEFWMQSFYAVEATQQHNKTRILHLQSLGLRVARLQQCMYMRRWQSPLWYVRCLYGSKKSRVVSVNGCLNSDTEEFIWYSSLLYTMGDSLLAIVSTLKLRRRRRLSDPWTGCHFHRLLL
jgi:hypothetical protein